MSRLPALQSFWDHRNQAHHHASQSAPLPSSSPIPPRFHSPPCPHPNHLVKTPVMSRSALRNLQIHPKTGKSAYLPSLLARHAANAFRPCSPLRSRSAAVSVFGLPFANRPNARAARFTRLPSMRASGALAPHALQPSQDHYSSQPLQSHGNTQSSGSQTPCGPTNHKSAILEAPTAATSHDGTVSDFEGATSSQHNDTYHHDQIARKYGISSANAI